MERRLDVVAVWGPAAQRDAQTWTCVIVQLNSATFQFSMQWLFDHISKTDDMNWEQIYDVASVWTDFLFFARELDLTISDKLKKKTFEEQIHLFAFLSEVSWEDSSPLL